MFVPRDGYYLSFLFKDQQSMMRGKIQHKYR